jgi:hypothetical protein
VRQAQGRTDDARALLRDALAIADGTEYVLLRRSLRERLDELQREHDAAPTRS